MQRRDEHFGNGRLVRNLFENAIRQLANRIVAVAPLTRELLTTFESDDIDLAGVPGDVWDDARLKSVRFRVQCPHCGKGGRLSQHSLGQRVTCRSCQQAFVAEWGEPMET